MVAPVFLPSVVPAPTIVGGAGPWIPLYGSHILETRSVFNPTDANLYPQWRITGPGYYLILTNQTTGDSYRNVLTMRYGDTVTINFDPTIQTATSAYDGAAGLLVAGSAYWPLTPGANLVTVELGRTTSATRVVLIRIPPLA